MRRVKVFWRDSLVGTLPTPDSIRPPMSDEELAGFPIFLLVRSRSWLFEVRPGDFKLERRGDGPAEELVIVASPRIGPGDVGLCVGFEPAPGHEDLVDHDMIALADEVLSSCSPEAPGAGTSRPPMTPNSNPPVSEAGGGENAASKVDAGTSPTGTGD